MTCLEILDYLQSCDYSNEYICLCFMLNGDYYNNWFLNLVNTDKKYKELAKAITPNIVNNFLESMNDDSVNLNEYFKMSSVLDRANKYKAKEHLIKQYAKIMKVDISVAYHLFSVDEQAAINDMWNTVYENVLGEDYKERYPVQIQRENAYYIDKNGALQSIRHDRQNQQYYLHDEVGIRYRKCRNLLYKKNSYPEFA